MFRFFDGTEGGIVQPFRGWYGVLDLIPGWRAARLPWAVFISRFQRKEHALPNGRATAPHIVSVEHY